MTARSVRRLPIEQSFDKSLLNEVRGLPWDNQATMGKRQTEKSQPEIEAANHADDLELSLLVAHAESQPDAARKHKCWTS